jgi:hypothetical protein
MNRTTTSTVPPVDGPAGSSIDTSTASSPPVIGPIPRRKFDTILVGVGAILTVVFLVAGGLLLWGNRFADDYVGRELESQNISFPDAEALTAEGRDDLLEHAGEQVTTGREAEAYASYIGGHLEETADGATYADLGGPERAARTAVQAAIDDEAPQATIDELQTELDEISAQRNTLFKGETLRGLLLSTYAWSTVGMIAGIAAIGAFVAAAVMAVLVVLGLIHRRAVA